MINIGKNIKKIRVSQNMTQEQLAESLFVTRQTISNYETGKSNPDIDTIIKIADIFNVDVNTVIYGLPLDEKQIRAKKWALGTAVFLVTLLIADFVIDKIFENFVGYYPPPEYILKFTLFPFTFFVCGFFAIHLISLFIQIKPLNNLTAKIIRIFILIIILVLTAVALYYAAFFVFSFIKQFKFPNIHMNWRGFYGMMNIYILIVKHPYIFTVLGIFSWLFGLIYREK